MMKCIRLIVALSASVSFATGQSLLPIDRPQADDPHIAEAFDGKTSVRRTVDSRGLVRYMIRFFHEDVVGTNRGWYLSHVVLSVADAKGDIMTQSWLDVSGVSTEPPDKTKFRMIQFSIQESLEASSVLSIGVHRGKAVHFAPYRLAAAKTPKAEQDTGPDAD